MEAPWHGRVRSVQPAQNVLNGYWTDLVDIDSHRHHGLGNILFPNPFMSGLRELALITTCCRSLHRDLWRLTAHHSAEIFSAWQRRGAQTLLALDTTRLEVDLRAESFRWALGHL